MGSNLSDDQRTAAINIGFELAKFGIQHFMGRQLAKAEEQELLDVLREQEARRTFKTPDELLRVATPSELSTGADIGDTGHEE